MDQNIRLRFFHGTGNSFWKIQNEQFEAIATVILRIPGYFILDYWYQNDILNCIPRSFAWADVVSAGFAIFAVIQGILVLLLPLEQLVALYMHYLTVAVLAAADTFSRYYIESEKLLVEQWPDYGSVSFQGFSNMLMLQKSLFDPTNDIETLFLRHQVAAIVFHTLVATLVTFFLDLDYNKDKYVGRWFEIERFFAPFQNGDCVTADYSFFPNCSISVINSNVVLGKLESVYGHAVSGPDPSKGELIVSFPGQPGESMFTDENPNYGVIATDYSNYAVVYSCTNITPTRRFEYSWILGRRERLNKEFLDHLKGWVNQMGVQVERYMPTKQQNCQRILLDSEATFQKLLPV